MKHTSVLLALFTLTSCTSPPPPPDDTQTPKTYISYQSEDYGIDGNEKPIDVCILKLNTDNIIFVQKTSEDEIEYLDCENSYAFATKKSTYKIKSNLWGDSIEGDSIKVTKIYGSSSQHHEIGWSGILTTIALRDDVLLLNALRANLLDTENDPMTQETSDNTNLPGNLEDLALLLEATDINSEECSDIHSYIESREFYNNFLYNKASNREFICED